MGISARDIMSNLTQKSEILKELSKEESNKLKKVLLEMMQDVHNACKIYSIGYSLHGGTALGAIRHNGFIPWDDDLDIVMMRDDWERFKQVFDDALGESYILEGPNYGNKETKTYMGKIYKKGTKLIELQDLNTPFEKCIYIDVFIFENVSDNRFVRKMDAFISDFLKAVTTSQIYYLYPNLLMETYMGQTIKSKVYYKLRRFLGFLFSFISHKRLVGIFDNFVSRHPNTTKYITVPTGREYYMGEILPRSSWAPLQLIKFEDRLFFCQSDIVGYCRKHYGSTYMELPPEGKRERHFCVELEFGEESQNKK